MRIIDYDRTEAANYAERWALSRNADYYNFDRLGGDCTNFVSQCVFAGCRVMNYAADSGWFYNHLNHRSPAWSGVQFFYEFMTQNSGAGPFAVQVSRNGIETGDVIQLGDGNVFYHTLFVLDANKDQVYIAAHTLDSLWRPITSYDYREIRYLHIVAARV